MDATDFFNEEQPDAVLPNSTDDEQSPAEGNDAGFDLGAAVERDRVEAEHARVEATIPDAFEPAPYSGWMLTFLVGALLCISGIGLGAWFAAAPQSVPELMRSLGVTPFGVFATGVVLWSFAWFRRAQTDTGNRTDAYVAPLHDMLAYVSNRAETMVEAEDFDRSMVALARLDEKIQNLSRATKMYGKPLMDVATKVQEAASSLQEIEGSLNGVVNQVETSSRRLGADLERLIDATKDGFPTEQFEDLVAATRSSTQMLSELKSDSESAPDPRPAIKDLRKALDEVREGVDRVVSGLRKELDTLGTDLRSEVGDLGGSIQQKVGELGGSIERKVGDLGGSLHAKVGDLDTALRGEFSELGGSLKGEVSELGSSLRGEVSQLGNAIASLEERGLSAAAAPSSSSKASPKPSPQSPPSKSTSGGSGSKPKKAIDGLANSIAGERKTKGKNVLGAIAKLKQMRD